jgi:hypothetical protein
MELPPFFQEKVHFMEKLPFKYRPWLSSLAASLAGIAIAVAYFKTDTKASVYADAERSFAKWQASSGDESLFLEMKKALHKAPSLEKKYGALIAQILIEKGRFKEAAEMAQGSLKNILEEAPFHAAFAETTLLIEGGIYQEALEKSVGLRELMNKAWDLNRFAGQELVGGALLYAHNLVRIACLHQALINAPGEMAAWLELEAFLAKNQGSGMEELIQSNFQMKGVHLSHYIEERKKQLSSVLDPQN